MFGGNVVSSSSRAEMSNKKHSSWIFWPLQMRPLYYLKMLGTYYIVMCCYIPGEWIPCLASFWCGDGGLFFSACKPLFCYTVDLERNCGSVSSSSWRFRHTLAPFSFCLSLGRHMNCVTCSDLASHSLWMLQMRFHLIHQLVDTDVSFSWTSSLPDATFLCVSLVDRYPKCSASLEGGYYSFELWKSMKCHTSQGDTSHWCMLELWSQQHMVPQFYCTAA